MNIIEDIKEERIKKGINQVTFAKKLKMTQSYVSLIENGEVVPKISTVDKMAKVLGKKVILG